LGASVVVVHAGHVCPESGQEKRLRALLAAGEGDSNEYRQIQRQMIETRAEGAEAAFASVRKSILELLAYADSSGVRLGIENRYHFLEIPSPNELESLLDLARPERIGFLYDVGHAEVLDHLGFYPHEEWLQRFASRIIGTHLHDVRGTKDHYAPGLGDVNFDRVAAYLPGHAFRTCEFQNTNSPEQVKAGLKFLVEKGCIKPQNKEKS
jgi:sugar phosphate isomerase/epimerase